jgi:Xaa-Pro aminopeptidase
MGIRLIYASPERDADLLYWSRVFTCDCFLAFEVDGRRRAISNALDIDDLRQNSSFDEVSLPDDWTKEKNPNVADLIQCICEKFPHGQLELPSNFPAYLLLELQERHLPFSVTEGAFLPERSVKSPAEVDQIRRACAVISEAFWRVRLLLAEAEVVDGFLHYDGKILTSEWMRSEIAGVCFSGGAVAKETIVGCGERAASPHNRGSGALRANEFIVVDIFPRLLESGYYGDMTRTFLRGMPSKEQVKMYDAVRKVQTRAIGEIRAGKNGREIHENNVKMFADMGYLSTDSTGFFHGTGHGVGLDLHESPSIGTRDYTLQTGEIVTVEPGLYYPKMGGVRIEDVAVVRENGAELLSNFSYDWVI